MSHVQNKLLSREAYLCQNVYDWVTLVIKKNLFLAAIRAVKRQLFLLLVAESGPLFSLQPFGDVALAWVSVKKSPKHSTNTSQCGETPVCFCVCRSDTHA